MHKTNILQFWCFRKSLSWLQTWHLAPHSLLGFSCNFRLQPNCTFENNASHLWGAGAARWEMLLSLHLVAKASTSPSRAAFPFVLLSFQNVYAWPPKNRKRSIYLVFRSKQSTAVTCWGCRPSMTMKKATWEVRLRFNTENPQDPRWADCLCQWATEMLMGNKEVLLPSGRK